MMKFIVPTFLLLTLFLTKNLALDAESYIAYIEDLSHNETFFEEYAKWSSELFSQSSYLIGDFHAKFPCSIDNSTDNNSIPTSVHALRPSDIKFIGAIGDSFTTGLGARALTPMELLFEYRGISWSVGGDYQYPQILTIPNVLRQYNPKLKGFSTKGYMMTPQRQHITNNRLNVAKSGNRSNDLSYQAEVFLSRLNNETLYDAKNDWTLITIFAGSNGLCTFCEDANNTKHTPEQYINSTRDTLDILYNASVSRMLVNLVLAPDIRGVKDLGNSSYICQTLLKKICPCAAFPTAEQAKTLDDYITKYQQGLSELIDSKRYEGREDFTVVIQPFMTKNQLPYKANNQIDFSYFAPDCFHFSGKGHSQAALSLWNNMFEPVGGKRQSWYRNESLKCPTKEYPYIFTSKNSVKALEELNLTTTVQPTSQVSTNINYNYTLGINTSMTSTPSSNLTSNITTTTSRVPVDNSSGISFVNITTTTSRDRRKRPPHKKGDSDSSFSKMKFIAIIAFLFIIIVILITGFMRQRKQHVFIHETERNNYHHFKDELEEDEEEIYSQSNQKSPYSDKNEITKTHGTRMSFE